MNKKTIYLTLCVIGFLVPYSQFISWLIANGLDLGLLRTELGGSRLAMFFVLDVVTSAVSLGFFAWVERRSLHIRYFWLVYGAIVTVGVSLGLPLFLYLRQRAIEAAD